ncbi:ORF8 [Aviadenovirus cerasi]|uniref:ORF8 n=1 Tax=Fowl aviadenovirus 5 TaxID=172861 RepID=A0A6M3Z7Z9_9ADEN|nr:ORF8 [Fowl aviadenovirus 5]
MEHCPLVCKAPLDPYDVGTISFATMELIHEGAPLKLGPRIESLSDGVLWNPDIPAQLFNCISIRSWGSHGKRVIFNGHTHRMYHALVRVCTTAPVTRKQAGSLLLSLSQRLLCFPARYNTHPLVMQLGVESNAMGLPIYSERALKMALKSMRVRIAPNSQQVAPPEIGRPVREAPQKTPETLQQGVFSNAELKSCLPKWIFHRFFNQTPYICGWKIGTAPKGGKWMVTINPEGFTHHEDGTKDPPTLQDLARLGVVENCLKMRRRGLGPRRYHPYDFQ